ncbi:hypothetical protein CALCODRAFT_40071 [Calocera cornea HHB12733]|uniref:F-box domain-containing protein n=1 Tax=Calocera cornea HHB12733 TaxID=1353952 RepID=A0A165DXK6_9BASI|nr:hypothetical protein CALCODRAFT_40071 [Calocera cornea HHB12733]
MESTTTVVLDDLLNYTGIAFADTGASESTIPTPKPECEYEGRRLSDLPHISHLTRMPFDILAYIFTLANEEDGDDGVTELLHLCGSQSRYGTTAVRLSQVNARLRAIVGQLVEAPPSARQRPRRGAARPVLQHPQQTMPGRHRHRPNRSASGRQPIRLCPARTLPADQRPARAARVAPARRPLALVRVQYQVGVGLPAPVLPARPGRTEPACAELDWS